MGGGLQTKHLPWNSALLAQICSPPLLSRDWSKGALPVGRGPLGAFSPSKLGLHVVASEKARGGYHFSGEEGFLLSSAFG